MPVKTAKGKSIFNRSVLVAVILAIVSICITTVISFAVSYSILLDKTKYIGEMLTDVAVEKTKTYLGDIADILNLAIKNEEFDNLFSSKSASSFDHIKARKDYEQYLKHLILIYDNIDALFVADGSMGVSATNNVLLTTDQYYLSPEFYRSVLHKVDDGMTEQFYLDKRSYRGLDSISIVCPIRMPFGDDLRGCIVAVLSQKFANDLQFAGDSIYLVDQLGTTASITDKALGSTRGDIRFENKLNFEGWTLINSFSYMHIRGEFEKSLGMFALSTTGLLLLLVGITLTLGRWAILPLREMARQIGSLKGMQPLQSLKLPGKRRISFKAKLAMLYFLVVTIPVLLITGAFYWKSSDIIEQKVGYVFEYNTSLLSQQINFIFQTYQRSTIEVAIDSAVQKWLSTDQPQDARSIYQGSVNQLVLYKQMQNKGIMNVSLYDAGKDLVYSAFYADHFVAKADVTHDLQVMRGDLSKPLWKAVNENYFNQSTYRIGMHVRGMGNDSKTGLLLGYILLDFNRADIRQAVSRFIQEKDIKVWLLDETGRDVLDLAGSDPDHRQIQEQTPRDSSSATQNELVIRQKLSVPDWELVIVYPINEYFNENALLFYSSLAVLAGLLLISLIVTYNFSALVSRGVSVLIGAVRAVRHGNLAARFTPGMGDEIEEVGRSFNDMLDKLNATQEEKLQSERHARKSELKAKEYELNLLQAQINPHFLYNTLRTAQYMVTLGDPRAERMIELLIEFFQSGVEKGDKLISLREEIQYIGVYMEIQRIRFSNRYSIVFDVPEDLLDNAVLKLTLQPIVENALYHGFDTKMEPGDITITGRCVEGRLCLQVRDNGLGMTEKKLNELRRRLSELILGQGIGIINVHERIQLHFGQEYGIEVESELHHGTIVTIWLPILQLDGRVPVSSDWIS